jgi:hypothetical protein
MLERVFVPFSPYICHGIDGERHIETRFIRLASRGFYARTGGHTRENNLRHSSCLQLSFQVGVRKGAPGAFGDEDVVKLLMQFGNQFTEVGGKLPMPSRLLCPPRSSPRDVNQNHRQLLLAKGFDKLTGIVDDTLWDGETVCPEGPSEDPPRSTQFEGQGW